MGFRYTYVDLQNHIRDIDGSSLNFAGNWVGDHDYFTQDVVLLRQLRYIALVPNKGHQPPATAVRDNFWSALALVSSGTSAQSDLAQQAFTLASEALVLAEAGTAAAAQAQSLAKAAYDLAFVAYAHAGTNSGTGSGGSSDLSNVYALARTALDTAWTGTAAGNQAYNVGMDAYRIAVQGTLTTSLLIDTILTTVDGGVVINSNGNVVTSGGP